LKPLSDHIMSSDYRNPPAYGEPVQQGYGDWEGFPGVPSLRFQRAAEDQFRVNQVDLRAAMQQALQQKAMQLRPAQQAAPASPDVVQPPRIWGHRPSFRKMLAGGNKRLVLTDPPSSVNDYYKNEVSGPFGCTYDDLTMTFFATDPGSRGGGDGKVVALHGGLENKALVVADKLANPAAISVYEPGKSVCVVTDEGIFVYTRSGDGEFGAAETFKARQIADQRGLRGIARTEAGGILTFLRGRIRIYDGYAHDGEERLISETDYQRTVEQFGISRAREKVSFLDVCDNKLAISDLGKQCISLWEIEESTHTTAVHFLRVINVGAYDDPRGRRNMPVPNGLCAFASGIRLDGEGWVICADAVGRSLQVWDNQLRFVTRVFSPSRLPYISGFYIEGDGHMLVCDRRNEYGGLRCYLMEGKDNIAPAARDFAVAARHVQQMQHGYSRS
ncbi:hypothetical protein PFISCL1PPCAC_17511, partial [Pristionchus fissidentatus]